MQRFGLIGFPLSHSFSKSYFTEKFRQTGRAATHCYELYPLPNIEELPQLLQRFSDLRGLNVTLPYKEAVLPYLSQLSLSAGAIGAVNTIRIEGSKLIGYNTDAAGFTLGLDNLLSSRPLNTSELRALILGTGGASKAVSWVLQQKDIPYRFVSRQPEGDQLSYNQIDAALLHEYRLVINTTPVGMYPDVAAAPKLPYAALQSDHLLYDLVYNPEETQFLKEGHQRGAATLNGLSMLYAQAERAWEIWNEDL